MSFRTGRVVLPSNLIARVQAQVPKDMYDTASEAVAIYLQQQLLAQCGNNNPSTENPSNVEKEART